MSLFFPKKNRAADRAAAEVLRPGWLRALLMLLLFITIGALYWRHFDNRLADIQARSAFWDETETWTDTEKRTLARRAALFREQWGVRVVAHVRSGVLELPELTKTTLFVGMAPSRGEAILSLPGLAGHAFKAESSRQGHDLRLGLEEELTTCIHSQPTADCLIQTLDGIQAILTAL